MHESDVIDQFCRAMREQDIPVSASDIVADGKFHRVHVDGDRKGVRNGWYVLHLDGRPAGSFGCNKRHGNDVKFKWTAEKSATPLTPAERKAWRDEMTRRRHEHEAQENAKHAAAAEQANRIWNAAQEATEHPYLTRKGVASHGLRIGAWEKVNPETGEVRVISNNALLVPIWARGKKIHSLQAIFPNVGNALRRDKDYLSGGEKEGLFYSIGKPVEHEGKKVVLICEGYATGASLHECTGHAVIVAFDASNLMPVAKSIRAAFPDAFIVVAADNDRWTTKPVDNPGVTRAREAAISVGGLFVAPDFSDLDGKPTDFNDLHQREGADAVDAAIAAVLAPEVPEDVPTGDMPPWDGEPDFPVSDEALSTDQEDEPVSGSSSARFRDEDEATDQVSKEGGFTVLGYEHGTYYLFLHEKKQIMGYTIRNFSSSGLVEIAPLNFWELYFQNKQGGVNATAAADFIIRLAHKRGIYDPHCVRACGAWVDEGRFIFHHGSYLSVDGESVDVTKIRSYFVYELMRTLPPPADAPLSDDEGARILDVAKMFRWSREGSAALLAGWVFLAPICGALRWRPHVWLTGPAGNGKSTILEKFVFPLIGRGACIYGQGNSTEAGVRQRVGSHALPVLLDEAEKNSEKETARVEALLSLIRQSSTESAAETLKGTVNGDGMSFHVRSMFCLASILVGLDKKADIDRLSVLALKPSRGVTGAQEHWNETSKAIYDLTRDPELRARLLRRAIAMLPTIHKNIDIFVSVAAKHFGSQRDGDQYGTLLAGAWSLIHSEEVTRDEAEYMVSGYDWDEHTQDSDQDESQSALGTLMDAIIREPGFAHSVHELIRRAVGEGVDGLSLTSETATAILRRNGVLLSKTQDHMILPNQSAALRNLLSDSPYAADPKSVFGRLPGASNNDGRQVKVNGRKMRVTSIPLSLVGIGDDEAMETF